MARGAPKDSILVPAALLTEAHAAMLERGARRAEREYKRTRKVGHLLGATWLKAYAQHLRTAATLDKRFVMPMPPEAKTQPQPGARKRGGRRP